ncbi:hypothetical protein Esi_0299_0005 [Ectocarpus siliculosus]|uniref:Uncharacterized protein n=1 Tax=Ectocarpus siliculosus TaxID=2880 RepID=D7FVS3_ECTSI|nr:hypothetical protein Esi_0299_0005 [Ectocarpus siliculosus]|eukprot:CBJ31994.1 hypothetical protein Esi_0299_0005 [Ectocarpus siliculosus]
MQDDPEQLANSEVALPLLELAIQQMKVLPDDDDTTDACSKARSRVNRWAILERGDLPTRFFRTPRKDDDVGDIANEDSDDEVPETLAPGVGGDVDSETDDGVDADGDGVDAMAVDAV